MQTGLQVLPFDETRSCSHRCGIILAGGDGRRLLSLTRKINGDDRPKQFSAVMGSETLLHLIQRRVSRLVRQWQTLLLLTRTHEQFYADQVARVPSTSSWSSPTTRAQHPRLSTL